ncbi:ExbD/TolR family protein [Roseibium sp.]|uniref:ExbD/TolR family protein n=1 Tax=Roseibium sp. TaxID=1936156 RepID=UPI003BABDFED
MILIHPPIGKRRRIPLTPLIDVIFILVMFFLLSSTFGIWRPLDVALGSGEATGISDTSAAKGVPAVLINFRAGPGNAQPRLVVNGKNVPLTKLVEELDNLAEAGAASAVLIPDATIDFQQVVRVLDVAKTSRLKRVSLKLD